jgi:predicted DNA-binding transcriptional regulator AlpA
MPPCLSASKLVTGIKIAEALGMSASTFKRLLRDGKALPQDGPWG